MDITTNIQTFHTTQDEKRRQFFFDWTQMMYATNSSLQAEKQTKNLISQPKCILFQPTQTQMEELIKLRNMAKQMSTDAKQFYVRSFRILEVKFHKYISVSYLRVDHSETAIFTNARSIISKIQTLKLIIMELNLICVALWKLGYYIIYLIIFSE